MPEGSGSRRTVLQLGLALLCALIAVSWLFLVPSGPRAAPQPRPLSRLVPGTVTGMDNSLFDYGPGWRVDGAGADVSEPGDPWNQPAGRLSFVYSGRTLALKLAVGDYWGYLYVTVDGRPANRLAHIPGNPNSRGIPAGYRPLLAPERQGAQGPGEVWVVVDRAADEGPHRVEIEVWRSWGQIALRGVAVDALPPAPLPRWPGVALALIALWVGASPLGAPLRAGLERVPRPLFPTPETSERLPLLAAGCGILLAGGGAARGEWPPTVAGLALLALAGLLRPEVWTASLLFALPFYLHPLPILPGRSFNLIEIGVWGGLAVLAGHWLLGSGAGGRRRRGSRWDQTPLLLLWALVALALVAALEAEVGAVALREWRTLFLAAGLFALLLAATLGLAADPARARRLLIAGWLLGGATVAAVGLWHYASGQMVIQAEGVNRVRAFYGSPNNLALYLERTIAVGLALALFSGDGQTGRRRLVWWGVTLPQLAALVLTFSKGALFLALPALLLTLTLGGYRFAGRRVETLRRLWPLLAVGIAVTVGLLPFLGSERLSALIDLRPGATGSLRLNLWRSSLAMALDNPWLGVGPDNFLYAYRSGYILPAAWRDPDLNHPHNVLLDWWLRLGLGGVVLAAFWLASGLGRLWQRVRAPAGEGALALGCLAAAAGALAHGLIDASYALPDLFLVWVLLLHLFPRVNAESSGSLRLGWRR